MILVNPGQQFKEKQRPTVPAEEQPGDGDGEAVGLGLGLGLGLGFGWQSESLEQIFLLSLHSGGRASQTHFLAMQILQGSVGEGVGLGLTLGLGLGFGWQSALEEHSFKLAVQSGGLASSTQLVPIQSLQGSAIAANCLMSCLILGLETSMVVTIKEATKNPRLNKVKGSIKPKRCFLIDKKNFTVYAKYSMNNKTMESFIGKYLRVLLGVIIAAFVIIWLNSPMELTVTGSGEVSVPATTSSLSLTVSGNATSPTESINQTKAKIEGIKAVLKARGVDEADIFESQATVVPAAMLVPGSTGYQATVSLTAKVSGTASLNDLIADVYTQGAALVAQPVLSAENQDELEQQALNQALADAKQQAKTIARNHWKFLRKITAITSATSPTTSTVFSQTEATGGSFKITKAVAVTYKLW